MTSVLIRLFLFLTCLEWNVPRHPSYIWDNPFWVSFYPMSHNRVPTMEETVEDPPTSAILLDHCHFSQVIFNSVEKFYVPGGDVTCYYTLTQQFIPRRKDWIGIFRVSGACRAKWPETRGESSLPECMTVCIFRHFAFCVSANFQILKGTPRYFPLHTPTCAVGPMFSFQPQAKIRHTATHTAPRFY